MGSTPMGSSISTKMRENLVLLLLLAFNSISAPGLNVSPDLKDAVEDDNIDQYIRDILELIKSQMPNGIPDLGIPPLDPFEVPHFDIPHIDEDIIDVDIAVEELVVRNISTFETKQAHLDLEALTLQLQLDIADLRGDANYVLDGTVLVSLPIYGNGSMWLEVWGLELYGVAGVLINADGFLEVTRMNITAEVSGEIKLHLNNLYGDGNLGDSINNLLNVLGGFIFDLLKDILFPLLDKLLIDILNDVLSTCSIADLIANGSCFQQRLEESLASRASLPLQYLFK